MPGAEKGSQEEEELDLGLKMFSFRQTPGRIKCLHAWVSTVKRGDG